MLPGVFPVSAGQTARHHQEQQQHFLAGFNMLLPIFHPERVQHTIAQMLLFVRNDERQSDLGDTPCAHQLQQLY